MAGLNAVQVPSPIPDRVPGGFTPDQSYQPLADSGGGDPAFYHTFFDDFDAIVTGQYTTSASGAGTVAALSGDGGLALFTTAATANSFESIQPIGAGFVLNATGNNPPATMTELKKIFFGARVQLADVTLSGFIAGLCALVTTPFTTGVDSIVDGIYFYKAPGAAVMTLQIKASSGNSPTGAAINTTVAIPIAAYTLANNINFDIAFHTTRTNDVLVFIGSQLFGYIPQSGSGPVNSSGVSLLPTAPGPAARLAQAIVPTPFSTAALAPTIAVTNGITAVAKTMTADFLLAQKER